MEENKKSKLFENSNPRLVFVLGLVIGVGVFSLLSLAILISMAAKDDNEDESSESNSNANVNVAAQNTNSQAQDGVNASAISITDVDYVYGNSDAEVTFVEFSDFQCPYCSKFHPTMASFAEKNKDKIRWVFKHFPLKSHPQAQPAAIAAECAGEQGKYYEYVEALFENQDSLAKEYYPQLAAELGISTGQFETCLTSPEAADKVSADYQMALQAGVTGTPNVIVMNKAGEAQMVSGAVDEAYLESVFADLQ